MLQMHKLYVDIHIQAQGFPGGSMVKNLPAMWETQVQFLGQEDPWRREWQPTPVLQPRECHGLWSLADYSLKGRKESDTTEQ